MCCGQHPQLNLQVLMSQKYANACKIDADNDNAAIIEMCVIKIAFTFAMTLLSVKESKKITVNLVF